MWTTARTEGSKLNRIAFSVPISPASADTMFVAVAEMFVDSPRRSRSIPLMIQMAGTRI